MKATVQRIQEVRQVPDSETLEIAEVLGRYVIVKAGEHQSQDLIVLIETQNSSPNRYFPTNLQVRSLSSIEGPEEMKVGMSQQPWGEQLQLGPYDNALVIEEGADVTHVLLGQD